MVTIIIKKDNLGVIIWDCVLIAGQNWDFSINRLVADSVVRVSVANARHIA